MANHVLPNRKNVFSRHVGGVEPFKLSIDFLAADVVNGDTFVVGEFDKKLISFMVNSLFSVTQIGLDSNATETLTLSVGLGTADGTITKAILTDGDIVTELTEHLPTAATFRYVEATALYLIVEFTAAVATAADGNITIQGATASGTLQSSANAAD